MDTQPTSAVAPRITHAPVEGRAIHSRLAGTRPQADAPPFWGEDGFTFDDLIDLINPLHHIPFIGAIYRALTGDTIAFGPRILGGALFGGGPIGAAVGATTAAFNGMLEYETGKDAGSHMLAWLGVDGVDGPPAPARMVAEIDGLPWLEQTSSAAVETAEIDGLPWLEQTVAEAPEAAPASAESEPAAEALAAIAPAAGPGAGPALSPGQWRMLTASLAEDTDFAAPPARARPHELDERPRAPADVAAAMTRALDKYQTLTRARAPDHLVE